MDIIWSEYNHIVTKSFGSGLKGLKYKNQRPDKVIIYVHELEKFRFIEQLCDYINNLFRLGKIDDFLSIKIRK